MTEAKPPPTEDEQALVAWLQSHDAACPVCAYGLRGLPAAVCPECGAGLELTVGSQSARLGAWLVCVLSLALGIGFDLVAATLIAVGLIVFGSGGDPQPFILMGALLLLGGVCGALTVRLVRTRVTFLRRPRFEQWRRVMLWFAGVGVGHAAAGIGLVELLM